MYDISHRKSACSLTLLDQQGRALANQEITAELVRHEFLFGCGAFDLLPLLDPATPPETRVLLEKIWEAWQELFNYATLPFYQGRYEPTQDQPDAVRMGRAADLLASKGIPAKGHPLCWHTSSAKWLMQYDTDFVLENQKARIRRDIGLFRDRVHFWDVINEVVIMPEFVKEDNAITPLCQHLGRVPLVKALFDTAREADPDAVLLINDFNLSERYRQLVQDCLEAGVCIDAIGLQTHQHQGAMGLEKLEEIVERFAPFGLPLHFTENTFISGQLMPPHIVDLNDFVVSEWPTTPEGEERQAQDALRMIDYVFSRPEVEAFTTWCIIDDRWLHAPAGLLRRDGSRKPSFEAIKQRIRRDWHTSVTLHTDENGVCTLEGFRGTYELRCHGTEKPFVLSKDCPAASVVLA